MGESRPSRESSPFVRQFGLPVAQLVPDPIVPSGSLLCSWGSQIVPGPRTASARTMWSGSSVSRINSSSVSASKIHGLGHGNSAESSRPNRRPHFRLQFGKSCWVYFANQCRGALADVRLQQVEGRQIAFKTKFLQALLCCLPE